VCNYGNFFKYKSLCTHAITACRYKQNDPYNYFNWTITFYLYYKTYKKAIPLISIKNLQSNIHIQPPFWHAQQGRPKTSRIRKEDQEQKKRKCPLCGVLRHNTRTCTAGPELDHRREERARN
jgi:hypothetical protein